MKFIRSLIFILLSILTFYGCSTRQNELNESLSKLQKDNKDVTTLYFYPGSLKMLNLNNDSSFNDMIKDIKKAKLIYWTINIDSSKTDSIRLQVQQQIHSIIKKLEHDEFANLMKFRQDKMQVTLMLKKHHDKPVEFVGLFYDQTNVYILDLLGNISAKALPAILSGNMKMSGFQSIINVIKPESNTNQPAKKHDRKNTGN